MRSTSLICEPGSSRSATPQARRRRSQRPSFATSWSASCRTPTGPSPPRSAPPLSNSSRRTPRVARCASTSNACRSTMLRRRGRGSRPAPPPASSSSFPREESKMTDKTDNNTPVAAVTGAGTGLGRQLALGLAEQGYRVFGTALSPQEIEDLRQAPGGSVELAIVDVTDEDAVHAWAGQVTDELGDHGVDVLISNAGI